MRRLSGTIIATLAILSLAAATAPSVRAATATHISVTLREMSIELGQATVPAGPVIFDIKNAGRIVHELAVLKTDTSDSAIPARTNDASKAQEGGIVGEAEDIDPGKTVSLSLTLAPGNYVLLCNEPGHYAAGMHTAFVVSSSVGVTLKEMSIQLGGWAVGSGPVTFTITNTGTTTHELAVLKTDTPHGALPARPNDPTKAQEPGSVGEAEDIAPGATATLTLTLERGNYVLICNVAGHYAAGMHVAFVANPTLPRSVASAIERELYARGVKSPTALVDAAALLKVPGVNATDADRAAIAAGWIPRAVASDGSLLY